MAQLCGPWRSSYATEVAERSRACVLLKLACAQRPPVGRVARRLRRPTLHHVTDMLSKTTPWCSCY
jgi:hypothetical protein